MKMSDEDWRKRLEAPAYRVLRERATEAPFSGKFDDFYETGIYKCAGCGQVLFRSENKYDAGCGWPSFWSAVDDARIKLVDDYSHGMQRTEVKCGTCDGHLGHIFTDGPSEHGGMRYCINSLALDFKPQDKQ